MVSTGLTFGTISALFGLNHDIIDQVQYSFLAGTVTASAVIPTMIANAPMRLSVCRSLWPTIRRSNRGIPPYASLVDNPTNLSCSILPWTRYLLTHTSPPTRGSRRRLPRWYL